MSETITLKKSRYDKLLRDSQFLQALVECGVDNWEGYSEAQRMIAGDDDDE